MKPSILDEILEDSFLRTLEKNSSDSQKILEDFVDAIDKFTADFDKERREKFYQILSAHDKLCESESNDHFKIGVRFGVLLCFEVFGMNQNAFADEKP